MNTQELGPQGAVFARVDHARSATQGAAEVIYGEGKTPTEIAAISVAILAHGDNLLVTRASPEAAAAVAAIAADAVYEPRGRTVRVERNKPQALGTVAIAAAGTSDLHVVEECAASLQFWGAQVRRFVDVGVAGLHRTLAVKDDIDACYVIIVVAGMEGALASVIGGLTRKPLIAVPTSVGYGANFHGLAALLTMLSSCASGVVVVNIDSGFSAAAAARRILQGHLALTHAQASANPPA